MSMSGAGAALVICEISKRIDRFNIDRVALTYSSNNCENFFGMLAKFSHGKRINFGKTDSWEAYQYLVAGKRSDEKFEDKILAHAKIESSYVRYHATELAVKMKEYDRINQRHEKVEKRRKVQQFAKTKDIARHSKTPDRHAPDKLSPTESFKHRIS